MRHSKKLAALAITAGVAVTASAAFGWWSSSGNGTGSADSGSSSAFVVASTPDPDGPALAPITAAEALLTGAPVQTVAFTVTNNNKGHQYVASVAARVANANDSAWSVAPANGAGCSKDDFVVSVNDETPEVDLAPGDAYNGTISIYMKNRSQDQDDCQGLSLVTAVPLYIDVK
jgi:hypothetical protein